MLVVIICVHLVSSSVIILKFLLLGSFSFMLLNYDALNGIGGDLLEGEDHSANVFVVCLEVEVLAVELYGVSLLVCF